MWGNYPYGGWGYGGRNCNYGWGFGGQSCGCGGCGGYGFGYPLFGGYPYYRQNRRFW